MVVPARACFAFSVSWAVFSVPVVPTVGALDLRVCMYVASLFFKKKNSDVACLELWVFFFQKSIMHG